MPTKNPAERSVWSARPSFRPRQMLTAHQLNAGLADEILREQLLNRAVHGYGVVVGLGLAVDEDGALIVEHGCVELTGGLALDRHGRMLYWKGGHIRPSDIVGEPPTAEGSYTLSAHFATHLPDTDGCFPFAGERAQWRKEGVVFTLRPECAPVDRHCAHHPDGACIGHDAYVCRRTGARPGPDPSNVPVSPDVDWVLAEPGELCATGLDGWWYDPDPDVCVPIACVQIRNLADPGCEPCYGFATESPDVCAVRPFVYRNPLLYELVKGCDVRLPRVEEISWQDWIDGGWRKRVPWPEFAERIAEGLEIRFTRPVRIATINQAGIFVTVRTQEEDADYWLPRQVPMRFVYVDEEGDAERCACVVRLVPESDWLAAEVTGRRSSLFGGAQVEVTIRGQLLRDTCGRMLDARPLDIAHGERGHERPGGDFVSAFRVARRHRVDSRTADNSAD
ncbi:hypothetical protein [Actinopolymorpha rutila]|uniref:Uncharacterized protein n=1 Tax=Actinopolymorpha rutila TaxID=446787 RepID=A0A852ZJY6_9ACTN|nr:hypothetical protein [Actinopolymorpha rutila]NYH92445.1 hypothetical protein [Actinopolymorpha rutila]